MKRTSAVLAVILVFLFGISDEYHQSFTPGREPRFRDVLIDTAGAVLAILALWKLLPRLTGRFKEYFETFFDG
jgi:VanZ family protein